MVALAALMVVAAIGTAVASADAGGDEYTLNLPSGSNTSGGGAAGGGQSSGGSSASVSPATATSPTDGSESSTQTAGGTATGGSGSNAEGGQNPGDGSSGPGSTEKPRSGLVGADQAATDVGTGSSSDGGGVPVFLIVIAVIAAACVGVAIWRMRRQGPGGQEPGATTDIDPSTQTP